MARQFQRLFVIVAACAISLLVGCGGVVGSDSDEAPLLPNAIVSVASNGDQAGNPSFSASLSEDGRYVAFVSGAINLTANCVNTLAQIYVRDRHTGTTVCVSVDSNGVPGNAGSDRPSISADGRYVAFDSLATNLGGAHTYGDLDVYVHDRDADADGVFDEPGAISTTMVSVDSDGTQLAGGSSGASVSMDGRFVAFSSVTATSSAGPTKADVFVRDRDLDGNGIYDEAGAGNTQTVRVSVSNDGMPGDGLSGLANISADGRIVAFRSSSTNFATTVDLPGTHDIFVHDRDADGNGVYDEAGGFSTTLISDLFYVPGMPSALNSDTPCMSADGRYVGYTTTFAAFTEEYDANGVRDVIIHDRETDEATRVSVAGDGTESDGASYRCSLSADGRFVAFSSDASNLVGDDTNGLEDVFVHDRHTDRTARVTNNSFVLAGSIIIGTSAPVISADGRYVAFQSLSDDLVADDLNGYLDVFAFQRP